MVLCTDPRGDVVSSNAERTMMALFDKSVTTTTRTAYKMRAPVHESEVRKALAAAHQDVQAHVESARLGVAPEILVTFDDENVVVYWDSVARTRV